MGSCFSSSSSSSRTRMLDYYYNPALYDYDKVFPPYDVVHYANDLRLQEALSASLVSSTAEINHHHQLQRDIATRNKQEEESQMETANETAEPSSRFCMICMNEKTFSDTFRETSNCSHSYCVNYVNDLDLQESLSSSFVSSTADINRRPQLQRHIATRIKQEEELETETANETAEPSSRLCKICLDDKSSYDIFRGNCTHSYCTECTVHYVATKIEENAARIKCPDVDCTHLIEPYTCRDLIPKNVFERWDKALCESLIMSSEKVYCPFENCSAMMVVDDDDKVTETECPSCHRLFCAQCKVTWHAGIGCAEFQRLGKTKDKSIDKEEALLSKLAKNKKWRMCSRCKLYVEKSPGM